MLIDRTEWGEISNTSQPIYTYVDNLKVKKNLTLNPPL